MLKTRVLTALVMGAALLVGLFLLPSIAWLLVVAVIIGLGAWEWQRMAGFQGELALLYAPVSALVFVLLVVTPLLHLPLFVLASLFWLVVAPLWLARKWALPTLGNWNALLGWFLLFPAGLAMVLLRGNGLPLLAMMAIAWLADSCAYFAGRQFGRHKLAPTISPAKSWEGVAGGVLAVMIYSALLGYGSQMALWVVAGVILTAVSVVGDLLESLFKRQVGIKDSSNLLPGHGGVLDRVDSLLAILPVIAALQFSSLHFYFG